MKGFFAAWILALVLSVGYAQNSAELDTSLVQNYVTIQLSADELLDLSHHYSVDKVVRSGENSFKVTICLGKREYSSFLALGIPYQVQPATRAQVTMANSYAEMTSSWNRYPTYATYRAMLDTFRTKFPSLCEVEYITQQTPGNHSVYAVHISSSLHERGTRPSFLYSSTIHGDEPVGYYLMLRLIHYLLHNYETDARVRQLVDSVDIWICPLENPDGTYYASNNKLGDYPYSIRYNRNYEDMNRSYPEIGQPVGSNLEMEIADMIAFASAHKFTMSANFHGGAEVFNYPWDTWTSMQCPPADQLWWYRMGRSFADTCHTLHSSYMTDENNGITEGGDWYVITGSRQDYFNYFQNCREVTIEISEDKVANSSQLPNYWNWIRSSLLNYMNESLNGIRGVITDSITGEPIEAKVFVNNHDNNNSHVFSHLPSGDYHRPIRQGTYQVTFSASGYKSKTLTVSVVDGQPVWRNVALVPVTYQISDYTDNLFKIYPNPIQDDVTLEFTDSKMRASSIKILDLSGRVLKTVSLKDSIIKMDLSELPSGVYFIRVETLNGQYYTKKIVKK